MASSSLVVQISCRKAATEAGDRNLANASTSSLNRAEVSGLSSAGITLPLVM